MGRSLCGVLADEQWWLTDEEEAMAGREVAMREEYDVWDEDTQIA